MTDSGTHLSLHEPPSGAAFSLAGRGFHTGRWNRLRLRRHDGEAGWFRCEGKTSEIGGPGSSPDALGRSTRCGGVGPLEHLSAAALVHARGGWVLEADHSDLPLFDGSAGIWGLAFARLGGLNRSLSGPDLEVSGRWVSERRGVLEVERSDSFRLDVEWSRGPQGLEIWRGGREALPGLLEARTFVEADEWLAARASGWLRGTDASSGRLLRGREPSPQALELARSLGVDPAEPVWSGGAPRENEECAAHKALDLVGDIGVWIGYLPALSIRARDAGHDLHHQLGRALRAARQRS